MPHTSSQRRGHNKKYYNENRARILANRKMAMSMTQKKKERGIPSTLWSKLSEQEKCRKSSLWSWRREKTRARMSSLWSWPREKAKARTSSLWSWPRKKQEQKWARYQAYPSKKRNRSMFVIKLIKLIHTNNTRVQKQHTNQILRKRELHLVPILSRHTESSLPVKNWLLA